MALPNFLTKIVDWLRAGYPEGVPDVDYIPLFALLGSQLTNDEVTLIADELAFSSDPQSAERIKKVISNLTSTLVHDSDIVRVRAHLAAGGWPLVIPPRD
jgi:hypothetical protein